MNDGMELKGNTPLSIKFLQVFAPSGPWVLTAISPEPKQPTDTATFMPGQEEAVAAWLDSYQGVKNLYFMVNRPTRHLKSKASKEDVKQMAWLHVDVDLRAGKDPEKERERAFQALRTFNPPPTFIIDSGGGYQGFWKLATPIDINGDKEKCEEYETYNHQLELVLDGDHCFNLDRVMRLPGTINMPNAKKRAKGRVPVLAKVVIYDENRVYTIKDFTGAPRVQTEASGLGGGAASVKLSGTLPRLGSVDDLKLSDRVKMLIVQGCDPDDPNKWNSRSELLFHVLCEMVRVDIDDDTMASVIMDPDFKISESVLEKSYPEQYAARQIGRARDKVQLKIATIVIRVGDEPRMLDEAESALIDSDRQIYQRSGSLVRVCQLGRNNTGPFTIQGVDDRWLRQSMMKVARWVTINANNQQIPAAPSLELARAYLSRVGEWRVPELKGIISTPTMLLDGTVVDQHGYDASSALFLDCGKTKFSRVPECPSKADADAALSSLANLLRGFPFVPDEVGDEWRPAANEGLRPSCSRSVVLAAILTGVIRQALPTAPLFAFDAAERGTGKTYIVKIIDALIAGHKTELRTWSRDAGENAKALLSALRDAPAIVNLDNVDHPLGGEALCAIFTGEIWKSRELGLSRDISVSTRSLFTANGNNMSFTGGMERRVVIARLDARRERPDQRNFDFDPLSEVINNRGQYVIDALTILRSYIVAGRPCQGQLRPMGSFDEWSIVRETLVWLGQPDPNNSQDLIMAEDIERDHLREVQDDWLPIFGERAMTVRDVLDECDANGGDGRYSRLLRTLALGCRDEKISARSLGWWFKQNAGRVVDGRRFRVSHGNKRNAIRLEVTPVQRTLDLKT